MLKMRWPVCKEIEITSLGFGTRPNFYILWFQDLNAGTCTQPSAVLDAEGGAHSGADADGRRRVVAQDPGQVGLVEAENRILDQLLLAEDVGAAADLDVAVRVDHEAGGEPGTRPVDGSEGLPKNSDEYKCVVAK